ncbi:MAG: 3-deoxy-D-manno-octulosonic acid transferase [Proteobacteria bacterium]|nr:3-deoxy-D-manno-octulosonic acid transferase [Pseudomonadota bacterium]MBI3499384.1 3-deoxy-D-manno-octulosonic acid transferase [Pseudomonadota bacterium]
MTPALYRGLSGIGGPLIELYLRHRRRRGKEDGARLGERRGVASRARPPGTLLWVHAASLGEAQSALALIERLLAEPARPEVLVTTGTPASAAVMAERLPPGAFHQFVPVDRVAWVERFLDHWRPDLALWIESELWPNLVLETASRGIPMVLVNARLSERSLAGWRRFPGLIRPMLASFRLVLAQSKADGERLAGLGAGTLEVLGNLKFAAGALAVDPGQQQGLAAALGERPRWLAANTHEGEESAALAVHRRLARPGLLTMVAPRHPKRGEAIAALIRASGLTLARRSQGELPGNGTDIYLMDTLGEMGLFYALSGIAFIGGSLAPIGGHNPLEAAHFDTAILVGPDRRNNGAAVEALLSADAALAVSDETSLAAAIASLIDDPARRQALARAAASVIGAHQGVLDSVLERLQPLLPPAASPLLPPAASGEIRARA